MSEEIVKLEKTKMRLVEAILGHGHENVSSTNKTTFEITKETFLTKRGDCIIATGANKAAVDLAPEFIEAMKKGDTEIRIIIEADGIAEVVKAWGSPDLSFTHSTDLVVRKSDYACSRTLAIHADKAARDLSRSLVEKLRNPNQKVTMTLTVETAI